MKLLKDTYNKGNLKDYFKRNKIFITVSILIVLLSILSGFYNPSSYTHLIQPDKITDTSLLNNLYNILYIIIMGISFSIISIYNTVLNNVGIGYLLATQNMLQISPLEILIKILEYIFALSGAFLVTKMEVRFISELLSKKADNITQRLKAPFKDLLLTVTFIVLLLIIEYVIKMIL